VTFVIATPRKLCLFPFDYPFVIVVFNQNHEKRTQQQFNECISDPMFVLHCAFCSAQKVDTIERRKLSLAAGFSHPTKIMSSNTSANMFSRLKALLKRCYVED